MLLVTTGDAPALTDAYGLLKALDAYALQEDLEVPTPDLVVNLAASREEAQGTSQKLRLRQVLQKKSMSIVKDFPKTVF